MHLRDFKVYKPLYRGMRLTSRLSLMSKLFVMLRRLTLLYTAMFMAHSPWLQVIIFTALSVVFIAYLGFTHPYKSSKQNNLNLFNEGITCLVAYQVMVLNGLAMRAE